jgi:16S rRNA C967 or C1407 C5-methylase (RsmB/RsmF family)
MVQWALETLPLDVEKLPLSIPGTYAGMTRGLDPRISKALRIFPDAQKEGFFVCRMRKAP